VVRVVNRFGGRIQLLLLVDKLGKTHRVANVADGAEVKLDQSNQLPGSGLLSYHFEGDSLETLRSLPGVLRVTAAGVQGVRSIDRDSSLLENVLQRFGADRPQAGTYLAIVDATPAVPIGAQVNEIGSLHLVEGRW
jgi:hypothetical protein